MTNESKNEADKLTSNREITPDELNQVTGGFFPTFYFLSGQQAYRPNGETAKGMIQSIGR
jgi:hypothetical protein